MTTERTTARGGMETAFGFADVGQGEKQPRVNEVFHSVARKYDVMNDLMSAGLHRVWKSAFVDWLSPPKRAGDIAFRIFEASGGNADVTVLDINSSMLEVGQDRAIKKGMGERISFVEANAEELPFPDQTFDAYTIAFGIRNVPRIDVALSEAFRVLKPGGRFLCLEFSDVDLPILDRVYDAWSFNAIPAIGKAVTGDGESYRYLVESIRKFPDQENFAAMIRKAGFARVSFRNYTGGIAAAHSGWKL